MGCTLKIGRGSRDHFEAWKGQLRPRSSQARMHPWSNLGQRDFSLGRRNTKADLMEVAQAREPCEAVSDLELDEADLRLDVSRALTVSGKFYCEAYLTLFGNWRT